MSSLFFFFFNDTATTEIYTLSLHDALPILPIAAAVGTDDMDAVCPHEDDPARGRRPGSVWVGQRLDLSKPSPVTSVRARDEQRCQFPFQHLIAKQQMSAIRRRARVEIPARNFGPTRRRPAEGQLAVAT